MGGVVLHHHPVTRMPFHHQFYDQRLPLHGSGRDLSRTLDEAATGPDSAGGKRAWQKKNWLGEGLLIIRRKTAGRNLLCCTRSATSDMFRVAMRDTPNSDEMFPLSSKLPCEIDWGNLRGSIPHAVADEYWYSESASVFLANVLRLI